MICPTSKLGPADCDESALYISVDLPCTFQWIVFTPCYILYLTFIVQLMGFTYTTAPLVRTHDHVISRKPLSGSVQLHKPKASINNRLFEPFCAVGLLVKTVREHEPWSAYMLNITLLPVRLQLAEAFKPLYVKSAVDVMLRSVTAPNSISSVSAPMTVCPSLGNKQPIGTPGLS